MNLSKSICMAAILIMAACSKENIARPADMEQTSEKTCRVSFLPVFMEIGQGDINQWNNSRAGTLAELATTLSYWDYMDGEQMQADTVSLPSPLTLNMKYGAHHVYFLAHSSTGGSMEGMKYTPEKVTETFWQDFSLQVDENMASSQELQMKRVVSRAMITVKDAFPASVKSVRMTVGGHLRTLDVTTGNGDADSASDYTITWEIGDEYAGRSGLYFSVFTFTPTESEEFDVALKIEALGADGKMLYGAQASGVPLLRNRCTNAICRLFSGNTGITFSDPDDWNPAIEIEM